MSRATRIRETGQPGSPQSWRPVHYPDPVQACTDPRRGPHNRCRHATAAPPGMRRCVADPACPVRITDRPGAHCPWHEHADSVDERVGWADLMNTAKAAR